MADEITDAEGVQPSILIELLDIPKNLGGARPRSGRDIIVGVPTLVTNEELVDLGAFAYRLVKDEDIPADSVPVETTNVIFKEPENPAAKPPEEVFSPVDSLTSSSPGQSG